MPEGTGGEWGEVGSGGNYMDQWRAGEEERETGVFPCLAFLILVAAASDAAVAVAVQA